MEDIKTKSKNKFWYKTKTDEDGNVIRYKCWKEKFNSEDGGKPVYITRHKMIRVNGVKVRWYSTAQLKQMSAAELEAIKLKWKKAPTRSKNKK